MPPLLGSEEAGLGSVKTAAGGEGNGGIEQITSTGGTVTVTNPTGPIVNLETAGAAFGPAPPAVAAASAAGAAVTASRSDHTHAGVAAVASSTDGVIGATTTAAIATLTQNIVATWGAIGAIRYFACDTAAGNDANAGFSDVSQAAAGLVAVKTLARLMQIVPKFGNNRQARIAIKAGNYASDTQLSVTLFSGYQKIGITGTDTVTSAGATAFAGDANDTLCAGMTTATGLNAAGYNVTAYSVDAAGSATATVQLAGGGAVAFGAMPAMPYGCRMRGDVNTTTAALRNYCAAIIYLPSANQLMFSLPLAATPDPADVFYIEMPGVTGPTSTLINYAGGDSSQSNPSLELCGLSLGVVELSYSRMRFTNCNCTTLIGDNSHIFTNEQTVAIGSTPTLPQVGYGLRSTATFNVQGGRVQMLGCTFGASGAVIFDTVGGVVFERNGSGSQLTFYQSPTAGGNDITWTLGTNSSTVHGATCQVWGNANQPQGTLKCGLFLGGGAFGGRIRFSNMGANPSVRVCGAGLGVAMQGFTGGIADGNTDVGVDLGPDGISGNLLGAVCCNIAVVGGGPPSVTGTNGDVRTAGGEIVSWAQLVATGFTDRNGNRFGSTTGPLAVVKSFSGVVITSAGGATFTYATDIGNLAVAITGNETNPIRYPTSFRLINRLRLVGPAGTGSQPPTATLYKNGAATLMSCTLAAGGAAGVNAVDLAHPILFADGDQFDVRIDVAATSEGNVPYSASLEGPC